MQFALSKGSICLLLLLITGVHSQADAQTTGMTQDNAEWFLLAKEDLAGGVHHARHAEIFGKYVSGYNDYVLLGIDKVQATAPDGGGYFIGVKAVPAESPVGYPLQLFGRPLLAPPRATSYCSGATYAAFVEQLNLLFQGHHDSLNYARYEAFRMQEENGGRREDTVKFWGKWNDDGFGSHFALVQYAQMGQELKPRNARPGDFMNISWKKGGGHSVIFLGWHKDERGQKNIVYWASQTRTNGFGDEVVPLDRITGIKVVRLTNPENLFKFDVTTQVRRDIPGDAIDW
ncbi:MAG: hypothetical protein ACREOO_27365 [bacterium]